MSIRRPNLLIGAILALLAAASPLAAQTKPKILSVGVDKPGSLIFIGNSFFYYNNGINGHFSALLRSADAGYKFRTTMVTISGSGADWHDVGSYFRPDAIGKYSFDANNTIVFNKLEKLFDIAVMMDCSQCPLHPQLRTTFFDYGAKHAATVRAHGAAPVFFMSWAYSDKPEMTEQLAEAYTQAGNDNDALVIPAGLAFARAVKTLPEVNLYAADKRHPSLAGTYLATCTVFATLLKKSPVGLPYTAGLDPATAAALQGIAWDTVQDYFGTTALSSR